ncbi:mandelate racemase, partial [Bacillus sp. AFS075960]
MSLSDAPTLGDVRARAYRVPTDRPEADGTYAWTATTIVVVEIDAGPVTGLGYTYT